MNRALRYLCYLAFVGCSMVVAALILVGFLGFFLVPHLPACELEPGGCVPDPHWLKWMKQVVVIGFLPALIFAFVLFKRLMKLLLPDDSANDDRYA